MRNRRPRPIRPPRGTPTRRWVRDLLLRNNELLEVVAARLKASPTPLITVTELARMLRVRRGRAQRFAVRNGLLVDIGGGAPRVVVARLERLLDRGAPRDRVAASDRGPTATRRRRPALFELADD